MIFHSSIVNAQKQTLLQKRRNALEGFSTHQHKDHLVSTRPSSESSLVHRHSTIALDAREPSLLHLGGEDAWNARLDGQAFARHGLAVVVLVFDVEGCFATR